ncbi:uncharacterized protein TNCV_365801 [Trichonephila clavipes]|nr:uncharacterized protein TNCV_365801 [Trichonephila clavipes]
MGHTQVPQCPAPSERDGFGNVAKPTPLGTLPANLASTSNTGICLCRMNLANLASTSTTGIPVLMDVTNEQTIDISIGSATELRDLNISRSLVDVKVEDLTLFILGAVYIHPKASAEAVKLCLYQSLLPYSANLTKLIPNSQPDLETPIVLCGDFNCDPQQNSYLVESTRNEFGLNYVQISPTTLGNTTIDCTFTRNINVDIMPEIGQRVGRNQASLMRICHRWMKEENMNRRDRSQPSRCTTAHDKRWIVRIAVINRVATSRTIAQQIRHVTHHSLSARII